MLIISRHEGEAILIGESIEIVIAHIGRSRVKVAIRAPREVSVAAKEVKLVGDANRSAAASRETIGRFSPRFKFPHAAPMREIDGTAGDTRNGQSRAR
jgi:carbon storage regulator CsrA